MYGQLKKSPHNGMGVLGSSAVSTVSQATRLGKGSSIMARDECVVMLLENFLQKCSMEYTLYPWISLLESTLETSYKPQT